VCALGIRYGVKPPSHFASDITSVDWSPEGLTIRVTMSAERLIA
jgi:hypothetical protein